MENKEEYNELKQAVIQLAETQRQLTKQAFIVYEPMLNVAKFAVTCTTLTQKALFFISMLLEKGLTKMGKGLGRRGIPL